MNLFRDKWNSTGTILAAALLCLPPAYLASNKLVQVRQRSDKDITVNTNGTKKVMRLSQLSSISLRSLSDNSPFRFTPSTSPKFKIIVFLSAADCSGCLVRLPAWNDLVSQHNDQLEGYLVFVNSSPSEARAAARAYNKGFKVLLDPDSQLEKSVGLPETPITVLMDSSLATRFAQGATNTPGQQDNFADAVRHIALTGPE